MLNKINLITGETYTLGELFSGTRRIIIPDLQRDYCWGNPPVCNPKDSISSAGSYAEGFIDTLLEQFKSHPHGRLSLGLLYGYESPESYVQLCDGQQRVTTLFLLMGMLNRWSGDDRYRHYLMTDTEFYEGGHVPYLQYSIRESSLYFMSDLVYRFFSRGDNDSGLDSVSSIYDSSTGESCGWFYGEYATDPSIISMLRTLESIEKKRAEILSDGNAQQLEAMMEFLVDRLTFIYYDMGTRVNGEETFVIINTTGEPLSATENLKPLVINSEINKAKDGEPRKYIIDGKELLISHAWEEMENYFWKKRRREDYDTADNGFNEFLRWVTLLRQCDNADSELFKHNAKEDSYWRFPYKEIPMSYIAEVFNAFVKLCNVYSKFSAKPFKPGQGDRLSQIQLFVLLPLLAYLLKYPSSGVRQLMRLWKWLENLTRIENVGKAVNSLLSDVILIGNKITDIADILKINGISETIITKEERFKLEVISLCTDEASRRGLEKDIWEAQDMEVDVDGQLLFMGEISPLLRWAVPECNLDNVKKFDPAKFKHYLSELKQLLTVGDPHTVNDVTRRALLARGYEGIPCDRSYGWRDTWKKIIAKDVIGFRRFIDEVELRGCENIISYANIQADRNSNLIVRYPEILAYSNNKNFDTLQVSGFNVCLRSYAQPIPVALAAIMARMGAKVQRNSQYCGDWILEVSSKEGELIIKPAISGTKRVDKIKVTAVDGGKKLHWHVESPLYVMEIPLPVESADELLRRLNPSPLYGKEVKYRSHRLDRHVKGVKSHRRHR